MKRIIAFIIFLAYGPTFATTITAAAGGGNWSNTATWVGAATPTAADDVVLAITSGSVTVDVGTALAKSVTATAFVNNLNFSAGQTLTVSGNVQFDTTVSGMTLTGTGVLAINATANLLSAGQTFAGSLLFPSAITTTFGDAWTVSGSLISNQVVTLNSNSVTIKGDLKTGASGANIIGTTLLILNGTGTWSSFNSTSDFTNPIVINTSGAITLGTNISLGTGPVTYTSGTIINTGSTMTEIGNLTLNTGTMHWNNITTKNSTNVTTTLQSALNIDGTLLLPFLITSTITQTFSGAFPISCANLYISQGQNLKYTAGQTITVSNSIHLAGNTVTPAGILSATGSSSMFLKYIGNCQGNLIFNPTLTDVDATPSTSPVTVWNTGTLTRTTNIVNSGTYPPSCGGSSRGFFF